MSKNTSRVLVRSNTYSFRQFLLPLCIAVVILLYGVLASVSLIVTNDFGVNRYCTVVSIHSRYIFLIERIGLSEVDTGSLSWQYFISFSNAGIQVGETVAVKKWVYFTVIPSLLKSSLVLSVFFAGLGFILLIIILYSAIKNGTPKKSN